MTLRSNVVADVFDGSVAAVRAADAPAAAVPEDHTPDALAAAEAGVAPVCTENLIQVGRPAAPVPRLVKKLI
jgi:hypothetical protein